MGGPTHYRAEILEALIPNIGSSDSSNVYVKIHVEGHPPQKTKVCHEAGAKAVWNERFFLPMDGETELEIKQKRGRSFKHWLNPENWRESHSLGRVRLDAASTFGQKIISTSHDVRLKFPSDAEALNGSSQSGYILVRLHCPETLAMPMQQTHSSMDRSLSVVLSQLDTIVQIVDAASQINPYAHLVWQFVSSLYTIVRGQLDRDNRIVDLANMMEDVYTFVDDVKSLPSRLSSLEETVKKLLFQTMECSLFIRDYTGHGFLGRTFNRQWADDRIVYFVQNFTLLKTSLNTGVGVQVALISHRMYKDVQSIVQTQNLAKLHPADMDDPSRPMCLPQTRGDSLSSILSWVVNPSTNQNILWVYGPAGSGKSTIATTLANIARELGRLGAFVFFSRAIAARNDPTSVIRTLAFQLGEFDNRLGAAISNVIEHTPSIRQSPLRQQFHKLLVQPLSEITVWNQDGPVIVVIDALDECGRVGERDDLLDILALESMKLPPTLRIILVSRAEVDIQRALGTRNNIHNVPIDINSPANDKDLHLYLHDRLQHIRSKNTYLSLPQDWPGDKIVGALAARARGLFIWAFTAYRYVENGQDPEERLADLLRTDVCSNAESAMDIMYSTALESTGRWQDPAFASDFRNIIGIVIAAKNPLVVSTIDRLNEATSVSKQRPSLHTLQYFGCVFRGTTNEEPLRVIHPSFEDFITNRARCTRDEWFIDVSLYHPKLARQCIGCLRVNLKRNMGNLALTTSAVDIAILREDITYSCLFWIEHVCDSEGSADWLSAEVHEFLMEHLLHWIETMSLLKKARQTIGLLMRLEDWSKTAQHRHQGLCNLIADAVRFCQSFTTVIKQHPLLVYSSALPFTPMNTVLYETFKDEPLIPTVAGGFRDEWSPLLMDMSRQGGEVISLSVSPDGSQLLSTIARGCYVWDAISGELVIQGPKNVAMAIFAPCGQFAASCSLDGSIVLWDTFTGKIATQLLEPGQGATYALAFSPDGTRLISGGQSRAIIMWSVQTGTVVRNSPAAHMKTVLCLVFSPDGSRYASGSRDGTICIWATESGEILSKLLRGHSGGIYSIAFTPDGAKIVSCSDDKTICVWDIQASSLNGVPEAPEPIKLFGHHSVVFSVAVSPDGKLIASASKDTTVRLWSLESNKELTHLIRRHRMPVRCVAFLRQSGRLRVVTGAFDATVRIWDVESVGSMGVARRHKGLVSHVAFSPDGQRVVSGSLDRTVQVWDSRTGQGPLHTMFLEKPVHSVALTADRILAADQDGAVFAWDAVTGASTVATPADDPYHHHVIGPLSLDRQWITDSKTGTALTMLPAMSPVRSQASFGNSIALGLANGGIVIMHFPQPV